MFRSIAVGPMVAAALLVAWAPVPGLADEPKLVAGWLETLTFADNGLKVTAKLDTGAKTSAIDAEDQENFVRDGEPWVRFAVRRKKNSDERRWFEARVTGQKRIRTSFGRETRRTVILWVCLGGNKRRVLFTLGDREHMNYRVILGRRALEGRVLVDSAAKFILNGDCPAHEVQAAPAPAAETVNAVPAADGAD